MLLLDLHAAAVPVLLAEGKEKVFELERLLSCGFALVCFTLGRSA